MRAERASLRGRLLAGSASLVVGLSVTFVVLFTALEVRNATEALDVRGADLAGHLARAGRLGVLARDRTALAGPAEAALETSGVLLVRYTAGGTVVFEGRRGDQAGRIYRARVRAAAPADDEGLALFGDEPGAGAMGAAEEEVVGTVEVGLEAAVVQRRLRGALLTGGVLMAAFLALGLCAAWLLAERVLRPLSALTDGVRLLGAGDLTQRVPAGGPTEVASLGRAYNEMAAALERRTTEVEQKTRDLEEFVYIASHDLQSPLISIQGFSERLLGPAGPALADPQRRWIERIQANVDTMGQLIRGILDLSRLNTRRNEPAQASSLDLLRDALRPLADSAEERGAALHIAGDDADWPRVEGDLPRLQAVFANLVDNALKYMGPRQAPAVEIGCRRAPGAAWAEFWVRDNGIGIDPAHHERIFRPLERLRTVEVHGAGMGLTLVRKIVETHGGRLWLESVPGEGSTFRFTLPVAATRAEDRPGGVAGLP